MKFVVLLRGINVGGHRKIPMVALRELCQQAGCSSVQSYIQSGNLVLCAEGQPAAIEARLEAAICDRFGFSVDTLVRSAEKWQALLASNPFVNASETEPQRVLLLLGKRPPLPDAVATLQQRADSREVIVGAGEALWIHYANGIGDSKLSPALIDRLVGSPVTARNWRTVQTLAQLVTAMQ